MPRAPSSQRAKVLAPEQKGAKPSSERKRWEREDSGLSASEQPGTVEGQEQCQSRECLRATEITGCVPGFRKAVIFFFLQESGEKEKVNMKVAQSCLTLQPHDSSVHGIFQARILEWLGFPSSRGSCQPRDQTQISHTADRFFTS